MHEKLTERNFDLLRVLFSLKQSLDIYRIITLNAAEINIAGAGKSYFVYTRNLALESCVVNICKLFEIESKPYELNSIPSIIKYLREEKIECQNSEPIRGFIQKYGFEYRAGKEIEVFEHIFKCFCDQNDAILKTFKNYRDKRIAHVENIPEEKKGPWPSYAEMEKMLNFGSEFYSTVQHAYGGSFPVELKHETKVLNGLLHLLELKGIKEIKKDFED